MGERERNGILSGLTECARVYGICLQLGFVLEGY